MPMFSKYRCENCGSTFSSDEARDAEHNCEDGPKHYVTPAKEQRDADS
jgi:transposase-like protein